MIGLARSPLIVIGAALFVTLALLSGVIGAAPGALASVPHEETKTVHGWAGKIEMKGGRQGLGNEYVASWDVNGRSETVVLQGSLQHISGSCGAPNAARYKLYVDGALAHTSVEHPLVLTGGGGTGKIVTVPSEQWTLAGPSRGDRVLKAELEVSHYPKCISKREWMVLGIDGARLLDGAGSLRLAGGTDRVTEGEIIKMHVETGAGGPWRLDVLNGIGQNHCGFGGASGGFQSLPRGMTADSMIANVCRATLMWNDARSATVEFRVPHGSFREDGRNEWKFVLTNEVFKRGEERAFVIDKADLAPETPVVTVAPATAKVGDTITLSMQSRVNPKTQSPIKDFIITAWYGGDQVPANGDALIVSSHKVTATANAATYQFVVTKAANVNYRVSALDQSGRPSGSIINAQQVKELEQAGMPQPNANARGEVAVEGATIDIAGLASPGKRLDTGLLLILGVIVALVGLAAFTYFPGTFQTRAFATALVFVAGGAWAWGVVS